RDPDRTDRPDGVSVSMDDIRAFRQWESRCPGHPEFGVTAGVETTTGPLGQGLAVSVGMAMAGSWLAARYNTDDFPIIDYSVFALCGDGCMMEGVSHEAAALAGHLRLRNLCWIYDSNGITIEGSTDLTMSESVPRRFEAYGWRVITGVDGNDLDALKRALNRARETDDRPVLIVVRTHIAFGSPNKQDSADAHGAPLGEDEVRLTKQTYGWPQDNAFHVPDQVYEHMHAVAGEPNRIREAAWNELFAEYTIRHPEKATELMHIFEGTLPAGWDRSIPDFGGSDSKPIATRTASGKVLNALAPVIPWMIGGSADLGPSNKSLIGGGDITAGSFGNRNIRFGIREFAMSAICNGLAHAGLRAYAATFLVFSDYARPALRLSALMRLPVLFIYTHDSISVGEDGPTHQPVEHLASFRAMPGMTVIRPADAGETAEAYRYAFGSARGPVLLSLSRQDLPVIDRVKYGPAEGLHRGAYILADNCEGAEPDVIVIATGSEVQLALAAFERLTVSASAGEKSVDSSGKGCGAERLIRVVSMPSWELFDMQSREVRDSVLPPSVRRRVVIEQGVSMGWEKYAGSDGVLMTLDRFGASAPGPVLERHFGFTVEKVVEVIRTL
ncbi:transketolase, partial [bacterium]|nr:transketolase [candidate division CSSED10-310 bacterium]